MLAASGRRGRNQTFHVLLSIGSSFRVRQESVIRAAHRALRRVVCF